MKATLFILAGAFLAVEVGRAQQEFSANAVAYARISLPAGFSILNNPLNNTNNSLSSILATAPAQTRVYRFADNQLYVTSTRLPTQWSTNLTFAPGEGFFLQAPTPFSITFIGDILQGQLSNPLIPGGYQMRGSQVPQEGTLRELGFPPRPGDLVFLFDRDQQRYRTYRFFPPGGGWIPGGTEDGPVIQIGEGFFLFKAVGGPNAWTRSFSVN